MSLDEEKNRLPSLPNLEYGRTISYIFENPNWLLNALCSFLCQLVANVIPIVPQMASIGYQFEVLDSLLASRGTRYTDFNTNRLGDYVARGLWPVLAFLTIFLVWFFFFVITAALAVACLIFLGGSDSESIVVFGILVLVAVGAGLIVFLGVVATPVMLRAGLAQDFGAAFDVGWISDFLRKMWIEVVLSMLFMVVVSLGLVLLTCGLGLIAAGPLASFMSSHFFYQFYMLYLARGGFPIQKNQQHTLAGPAVDPGPPIPPKF